MSVYHSEKLESDAAISRDHPVCIDGEDTAMIDNTLKAFRRKSSIIEYEPAKNLIYDIVDMEIKDHQYPTSSSYNQESQVSIQEKYRYCYCCCCIQLNKLSLKFKILLLLLASGLIILVIFVATPVCPYTPKKLETLNDPFPGNITYEMKQTKTFNVVFLGDSMLSEPIDRYDLVGRISAFIPSYKFTAKNSASNAIKMINLRQKIMEEMSAVSNRPDGIIVMCNSDITDVKFDPLNSDQKSYLLKEYIVNLEFVIQYSLNASVPIAISSPVGVLTEGPLGAPDSVRYHNKKEAISSYTSATKDTALRLNVPYVDIRTPTLAAIPMYRLCYLGCVTYDGEHPNIKGTDIFATLYAKVLNEWFYTAISKSRRN